MSNGFYKWHSLLQQLTEQGKLLLLDRLLLLYLACTIWTNLALQAVLMFPEVSPTSAAAWGDPNPLTF